MNEELKPENNLPANIPPVEQQPETIQPEVVKEEKESNKTRLELLPPNMRKDLDDLIKTGFGARKIKIAFEDRYEGKTQLLPVSEDIYLLYIRKYKDEIMKQVELQKSLIESTKESLADVNAAIETTLNDTDSLENKKKIFEKLYQRINERIELLTEAQASSFLNPQMETVIGAYIREQRTIIEKLIAFKNDLEKDNTEQIYNEFENLAYMWLVTVMNIYSKLHGNNKLNEFKSLLNEALPKIVEEFKNTVNKK